MGVTPGDFLKLKPLRSEDQGESTKKYILFGSLVLGVALVILIQELRSPGPQTDRYSAYSAAQKFVKETLKEPGTADFQSVNRAEITELDDNTWEIKSFVDSNDKLGKKVRTFFTVRVQFEGGEWVLKRISYGKW